MALYHCCHGLLLFLSFFFAYSSWMSVTNRWYHWLHQKYFFERSYYLYISLFCAWPLSTWLCGVTFYRDFLPEQWRHITVVMGVFVFFLCFILTDECDYSLGSLITSEAIFWAIILSLYITYSLRDPYQLDCAVSRSLDIFFQCNGAVSRSSWFFEYFLVILFGNIFPVIWQYSSTF